MPKIAVALSGGVDSAVSAALLLEQGFIVIGIFMKNWSNPINEVDYCPWIDDQLSARKVAAHLGIPFYTFNFEKQYKDRVLSYFLAEYKAGRTPNPDVMCNREIKFDLFLKKAKLLGADKIATGHYARVKNENGKVSLLRGKDSNKDQSYFLWSLSQEQLTDVVFPIGDLKKPEVRRLAQKYKLPNATRKDSQGICFVGPIDVYSFLHQHIPSQKGEIYDTEGILVGHHDGIYYYTIGQRHGLHLDKLYGTERPPLYVVDLDVANNRIIVGPHHALLGDSVKAEKLFWIDQPPKIGDEVMIQIRYRQQPISATITLLQNNQIKLQLKEPVWAITPGQSLVVYSGDKLVGGGFIVKETS